MANSRAVTSVLDVPMWESIRAHRMQLQQCRGCARHRYPPAPICPDCLSMDYDWRPISGRGRILSWVIFHRQYFDNYPPPYNAVAVQLAEGPIVISNLAGDVPQGSWLDRDVELFYADDAGVGTIPRFRLRG